MRKIKEILKDYLAEEQMAQLPDMESEPYPEFILSRDGQVYHLQDLYKVNALPGMIDDNDVIVPLKKCVKN